LFRLNILLWPSQPAAPSTPQANSHSRLHNKPALVYRAKIVRLREAFLADGGTETMEAARALIDRVEVHPRIHPVSPTFLFR
jgi:hypothetical protein